MRFRRVWAEKVQVDKGIVSASVSSMTMCSCGWGTPKKRSVCTRLYPMREEGCGEPCFVTCWTSHGACRGQSERQFDGCDCFGSRSALLTSAGVQTPPEQTTGTGAGIHVLAPPGDWLAPLAAAEEARSTSTSSLVQRMFRRRRRRVPSSRSSKAHDRTTPGSRDGELGGGGLPLSINCTCDNVCPCRRAPTRR